MTTKTTKSTPHAIWWLKKDFRLRDNPALRAAIESGQPVLPLFILEPSALTAPETSAFHVAAWLDASKLLRTKLRRHGSDLVMLRGAVCDVFSQVMAVCPFDKVFSHEEVGSDRTFQRDIALGRWCEKHGVAWTELRQTAVFRRMADRDRRADRWKTWMEKGPLPPPTATELKAVHVPRAVLDLRDSSCRKPTLRAFDLSLSDTSLRQRQRITEDAAQETLDEFLFQRGLAYSGGISSPNSAFIAGSRLSAHLAWGTVTGRDVYSRLTDRMTELKGSDDPDAGRWRRSLNAFRSRMHWRDHFIQRLETEPTMEFHALNRAYDDLPVADDPELLRAWCEGRTGFPLVDACIRCAQTTGFLNFRMRCMITSVACHAMRLHWRDIMWPMARWWADYEPGIHIAQLQMQAGMVGINTLRTYNPAKQIADHDPTARFVKRWIPELSPHTAETIIAHQDKPMKDYIHPAINWRGSTTAMRADYYAIRRDPKTKELAKAVLAKHGSRKRPGAAKKKSSSN